ncbi:MAG: hypothetical protein JHC26_12820 [Thermofilum sp.]|uniref:hypothetical protein n=1 Tax=Thermofilum sp. TaxID=1961369 RepID=UPI002587A20B|nr:hypothetical protein [Thermofilum sp.]MCI4409969.1 hypothetical protein [Thermofilum sp.]
MENEITKEELERIRIEDMHEYLKHISDTALELRAWLNKKDNSFNIAILKGEICIQGIHTNNVYKCVDKDNTNKSFEQLMSEFFSDESVLNEGLSMILDDIAVLIRKQ